jgi:predicted SAM-dependent methyltransferase
MTKIYDLAGGAYDTFQDAQVSQDEAEAPFDIITAGFVLGEVEADQVVDTIRHWSELLNVGGQLHVMVPSAEWAAREILGGRVEAHVLMHLYGSTDRPRRCCFTLAALRDIFAMAGLQVIYASTDRYSIAHNISQSFDGDRHYIVGRKVGSEVKAWVPS